MPLRTVVAVLAAVLGLCLTAGCRNFDFPKDQAAGPGPEVAFLSPAAGDRIGLLQRVRLDVVDPNGVKEVTLRCGTLRVYQWVAEPFEANVDFSACRFGAAASDGGLLALTLSAEAEDRNNNRSAEPATIDVLFDTELPALLVDAPSRVLPQQTFQVQLTTGSLQGPPTVRVGGSQVPVAAGSNGQSFTATVVAPAIGLESLTPAQRADAGEALRALEEQSRPFTLTVEARSSTGNTARRDVQVDVTRVLWERPVPGTLEGRGGKTPRGAASSLGLQLPLRDGSLSGGWLPGLLRAADGTFQALPDLLANAGFRGVDFDSAGRTLLSKPSGEVLRVEPGGASLPASATTLGAAPEDTFNWGERICFLEQPRSADGGPALCGEMVARPLRCLLPDGGALLPLKDADGGTTVEVHNNPTVAVGSGASLLLLGFDQLPSCSTCGVCPSCGVTPCGQTAFVHNQGAVERRLLAQVPPQVLSGGDGTFVLAQDAGLVRVSGQLVQSQTYPTPPGTQAIALMADDALLTLRQAGQSTVFERWTASGGQPASSVELPGLYALRGDEGGVRANVARGNGGELFALLWNNPTHPVVAAFDGQGRLRWLHHYPRSTSAAQLVALEPATRLYLLDVTNHVATALSR